MRVLVVYHFYAHYREPVLRALVQSEENDYVFLSGSEPNQAGLNPLKVINLADGGIRDLVYLKNHWFAGRLLWQTGLLGKLMKEEYDAVIFLGNAYFLTTWVGVILARIRGKRTLMWSHGLYGKEPWLKKKIRCLFYGLANGLLLYGNWSRHKLLAEGFSSSNSYVVYNSLDVQKQNALYSELDADECKKSAGELFLSNIRPLLLFIGRLTDQKNLDMLIQAAFLLEEQGKGVNLLFIGEGPEKKRLIELSIEKGLQGHVVFYGESFDELANARLIYAADICVAPGEVGLTAMHALVYGTPVITHNAFAQQMPEFEAIVPNFSGAFFEHDSVADLAVCISKWLDGSDSRTEIRKKCRSIIHRYFNTESQRKVIDAAVCGNAADEVCDFMDSLS